METKRLEGRWHNIRSWQHLRYLPGSRIGRKRESLASMGLGDTGLGGALRWDFDESISAHETDMAPSDNKKRSGGTLLSTTDILGFPNLAINYVHPLHHSIFEVADLDSEGLYILCYHGSFQRVPSELGARIVEQSANTGCREKRSWAKQGTENRTGT